jgi:hypothetical protein
MTVHEGPSSDVSLPAVLSRVPSQSQLPTELLLTVLSPLITPHKESRDHHLLITTQTTTPTVRVIRNVRPSQQLIVAYNQCPRSQDVRGVGGGDYLATGPGERVILRRGEPSAPAEYDGLTTRSSGINQPRY